MTVDSLKIALVVEFLRDRKSGLVRHGLGFHLVFRVQDFEFDVCEVLADSDPVVRQLLRVCEVDRDDDGVSLSMPYWAWLSSTTLAQSLDPEMVHRAREIDDDAYHIDVANSMCWLHMLQGGRVEARALTFFSSVRKAEGTA